jgi:hypothetical protein
VVVYGCRAVGGKWIVMVVVAALAAAGCDSGSSGSSSDAHSKNISRTTFDGTWPFTVDHGTLACDPPQAVTFTDPSGNTYGVNGSALDAGEADVKPIWKKDTSASGGPRVYIGDVIDAGLKLCGQ